MKWPLLWVAFLLAAGLAACQTPVATPAVVIPSTSPPVPGPQPEPTAAGDLATRYRDLAAGGTAVFQVDPARSSVRVYVFRSGRAARSGHNHVLSLPGIQGFVSLPSDVAGEAAFDLQVLLEDLVIDDPALRAETGGAFAGERSASDIEGTRRNLLGPKGLDAAQWPMLELRSLSVEGDWPMLVARVEVRLHGLTVEKELLLRVEREAGADSQGRVERLRVRGDLVLRQSEFGITPYSVLGGLLAVQDPVGIEVDLSAGLLALDAELSGHVPGNAGAESVQGRYWPTSASLAGP